MTMNNEAQSPAGAPERYSDDIEFIRLREVKELTSLSTTTVYDRMKKGLFPRQIILGTRTVRWIKSEVLEWNRQQVIRSRGTDARPSS